MLYIKSETKLNVKTFNIFNTGVQFKDGVHMKKSQIWSNIKGELLGLKWFGNTARQLTHPKESPRLVADCLVSNY